MEYNLKEKLAAQTKRREERRPEPKKRKPLKKYSKKDVPMLLRKAQILFNAFIRNRDSDNGFFICISSGEKLPLESIQAGHYVPTKNSSFLRFHEDNCHGESVRSNCFDEFHLIGYRKNLINKIGIERVNYLEDNQRTLKSWSADEVIEIIEKYSQCG